MKRKTACLLITLCFFSFSVLAQGKASPEAEAFFTKAMSQINTKHISWIKTSAKNANQKNLTEAEVRSQATKYGRLSSLANADIEALIVLVMMQASKDAHNDTKEMLKQMEEKRKQKAAIRDALQEIGKRKADKRGVLRHEYDSLARLKTKPLVKPTPGPLVQQRINTTPKTKPVEKVSLTEIEKLEKELADKRDSLSEESEEQQLKMQMLMDRMAKADSAASNLMKKFSETSNTIIQNLK
jgi:hypothetical protein